MIKFDSQYHLYDITPIENMFIEQYLVKSPGDYVKIYIYCLNMCYYSQNSETTYTSVASALKLTTDDLKRAFRYWSRLGVMSIFEREDDIIELEMHSIKDMLMRSDFSDSVDLYKFADFNNALSEAFSPRILDTQDYLLYQDMMNIFCVSEDYVIEAVKYSIRTTQSPDIPYKYVEKVIESRKNEGINTVEELRKYFETASEIYRNTQKILKYLGMNRQPTVPETACYKKWTAEYGFSFDAIKEACNQTLNASTPTFKYLDSIITGLHDKNISTPEGITTVKENTDNIRTKVRNLLYYLGITGAPSAIQIEKYKKWEKDYGFSDEAIELASGFLIPGKNPFEALDSMLESFSLNGITTSDQILEHITKKHSYDGDIKAIQEIIGKGGSDISDSERKFYTYWRENFRFSSDVIQYAAKQAISADRPWNYMNKVLSAWSDSGIKTVSEAEARNSRQNNSAYSDNGKKKFAFKDMDNHSYSDDEYSDMFSNIGGNNNDK